jgi:transposase-like protein
MLLFNGGYLNAPLIEQQFRERKKSVVVTYIKVKGAWNYLYRAVDKER